MSVGYLINCVFHNNPETIKEHKENLTLAGIVLIHLEDWLEIYEKEHNFVYVKMATILNVYCISDKATFLL